MYSFQIIQLWSLFTELNMSEDVVGATFMAAAVSSPDLFINIVGTFITEGDIGVGTVVGSGIFNGLAVPAFCGLFAGQVQIIFLIYLLSTEVSNSNYSYKVTVCLPNVMQNCLYCHAFLQESRFHALLYMKTTYIPITCAKHNLVQTYTLMKSTTFGEITNIMIVQYCVSSIYSVCVCGCVCV